MKRSTVQLLTGTVIMVAWLTALFDGMYQHEYNGLELVTPVMLIYAGYLFGDVYFTRKERNGP
jgi:ATP/ADP translocase